MLSQIRIVAVDSKDRMTRRLYAEDVDNIHRADFVIHFDDQGTINLLKNRVGPTKDGMTREEFTEMIFGLLSDFQSEEEALGETE